jgi:hypothetical protein
MGVTILNALFFAECLREGAKFNSTLTLGRLDCFMSSRDLQRIVRLLPSNSEFVESIRRGKVPAYLDDLFRAMGASRVDAMDASDFEGATILQDLNEPLAAHLHSKYDAVVDGGTLEHVFNVPTAFKNVMDALKVGGHFFGTLPANNHCGHGFYQFSAEFVYRVFSGQNGFEVCKLFVAPVYVAGKWVDGPVFEVLDPEKLRERVQIEGRRKMVFLVQARKVRQESVFATWPQQSDYSAVWLRRSACKNPPDDQPEKLRSAARTYKNIVNRIKGIQRLSERTKERSVWTRQSVANSALKPHKWIG